MDGIPEEAAAIVAERERRYEFVVANWYFVAHLSNDQETQDHIWQEAWDHGNTRLIMLLMLTEMHLNDDE